MHVGKTGEVGLHPVLITSDEGSAALQLAKRFAEGIWIPTAEYQKLRDVLPAVFDNIADED